MKIFNGSTNSPAKRNHDSKVSGKEQLGPRKKLKPVIERKDFSDSEIREKLAAKVELSNSAKIASSNKNIDKLGESFMDTEVLAKKLEAKPITKVEEKSDDPNTENHIMVSDVKKNSPTDTDTTEKLKSVLVRGAFNFNPKEREALDRILSDK